MKTATNTHTISHVLLTIVLALWLSLGRAELMPEIGSGALASTNPGSYIVQSGGDWFLAMDADPVTGRWVVCWWGHGNIAVVKCQLYAGVFPFNLLQTYDFYGTASAAVTNVQVVMDTNGGFYVLYAEDISVYTRVFTVDGASLQATAMPLWGLSFERHAAGIAPLFSAGAFSGYWLAGNLLGSNWVRAFAFDAAGAFSGEVFAIEPPGGKKFCQASMRANPDGDILFAWIEADSGNSSCWGKAKMQVRRPDGTASTGVISLPVPGQVSLSRSQIAVDGDGHFLVGFQGDDDYAYVARYSPAAGLIQPLKPTVAGVDFTLGAGSQGQHFAMANRNVTDTSPASCDTDIRFFDSGLLTPVLQRSSACMSGGFASYLGTQAVTTLKNGETIRAWIQNDLFLGIVYAQVFYQPVVAEIGGMSLAEGDPGQAPPVATATVSLSRPHPTGQDIQLNYYTRSDTAVEDTDFVGVSGTLTIPGGATQYAIQVPLIPDTIYEDDELFDVNLDFAQNVGVRISSAKITILNDDSSPPIENNCLALFPDNCQVVAEPLPGDTAAVTVTLSMNQPREREIYLSFSTSDETATAGEDYVATSGQVYFPPEVTSADITIPILGDAIPEATETFLLDISGGASVNVVEGQLRFAITDGPECLVSFDVNGTPSTGAIYPHTGGSGSFSMSFTHPSCQWNLSSVPPWVQVTSATSGTGDATITYTVDSQAGTGLYPRLEAIVVDTGPPASGTSFEIEQAGDPSLCPFILTPADNPFQLPVEGGDVTVQVSVDPACGWEFLPSDNWISVLQPTAPVQGDGTLTFHVDSNAGSPNTETPVRSGQLQDVSVTINIEQAGCSYSLPVTSVNMSQSGGQHTATILAPTIQPGPCQWTAQSHDPWIVILNGHSGAGGGGVLLDILENPSVQPRSGTVSIGDEVFTVNQDGIACNYNLSPSSVNFCADGGIASTQVQTQNGCDWQFTGQPLWLNVDSNINGVGPETTTFSVMSTESEQSRTGSVYLDTTTQNNVAVLNAVQDGYLVLEQFNSANLPGDWQFVEHLDPWEVVNGWLRGIGISSQPNGDPGGLAYALDATAVSYCQDCKLEADVRVIYVRSVSTAAGVLGWYQDANNQARLSIDEVNNALVLERIQGGVVQSVSAYADILPWQTYRLTLAQRNGVLVGSLDGVELVQLPITFPMPAGRFGVFAEGTRMEADEFRLLGISAPAEPIFVGGFEAPDFSGQSVCTQ